MLSSRVSRSCDSPSYPSVMPSSGRLQSGFKNLRYLVHRRTLFLAQHVVACGAAEHHCGVVLPEIIATTIHRFSNNLNFVHRFTIVACLVSHNRNPEGSNHYASARRCLAHFFIQSLTCLSLKINLLVGKRKSFERGGVISSPSKRESQ